VVNFKVVAIRYDANEPINVNNEMEHDFEPDTEQEEEEIVVIFDSNTIVDPWAVMIESFDTLVAYGAMSRSCRPNNLTLRAEIDRIDISQQLQERSLLILLENTGICQRS